MRTAKATPSSGPAAASPTATEPAKPRGLARSAGRGLRAQRAKIGAAHAVQASEAALRLRVFPALRLCDYAPIRLCGARGASRAHRSDLSAGHAALIALSLLSALAALANRPLRRRELGPACLRHRCRRRRRSARAR